MGWWFDGSVRRQQFWWGIFDKKNIHSFHLCMISGHHDEAWPMYHVWPIFQRFMLGWSDGTWPACCHWLSTGKVDRPCPIMFVLIQSYPCGMFVCNSLWEFAVSNLGQLLFCLSIAWSRCRNAYQDLWIMTIADNSSAHCSGKFQTIKEQDDRVRIHITSDNTETYNKQVEKSEEIYHEGKTSSPRTWRDPQNLLNHLSGDTIKILKEILNNIWPLVISLLSGKQQVWSPSPNQTRTTLSRSVTDQSQWPVVHTRSWSRWLTHIHLVSWKIWYS